MEEANVKTLPWFRMATLFFPAIFLVALIFPVFIPAAGQGKTPKFCVVVRSRGGDSIRYVRCFNSAGGLPVWIGEELQRFHNQGFPFASVRLDTLLDQDPVQVLAEVWPGPLIENGDVVVHGDSAIRMGLVRNGLQFRPGLPFSLRHFGRIPLRSSRLSFAEEIKTPDLEWFGNRAMVHVYLKKRRNNGLSGLIGLQPRETGPGIFLTGNVETSLFNLFGRGADLIFRWNRFAPSAQTAFLQISAPYLSTGGLGLEGFLDLIRQDTALLRRRAVFQLLATRPDLFQWFAGFSFLGSEGTLIRVSDGIRSVSVQGLQAGIRYDPDPGYQLIFRRRRMRFLTQGSVKALENGQKRKVSQLEFQTSGQWPVLAGGRGRFSLQVLWNGGWLVSDVVTAADQYRFGGNRDVRGFNENQFFAARYGHIGLQPQFLLDRQLVGGVFGEFMVYNPFRTGIQDKVWRKTLAFGFCMEAELGSALLQLAMANGFEIGQPVDLQTSKIHFGYVGRF